MKILFFGDIVGKIARKALGQIIPELKKEFSPDIIIANIENAAHGTGVTEKIMQEVKAVGVNFFTSGDHIYDKPEANELLQQKNIPLIRPANYAETDPGKGYAIIEVGVRKLMIVNLSGQVFMKKPAGNPFTTIDEILKKEKIDQLGGIIVDFHAEATSEKVAFGWYVDGRVSAVLGTHTHIPTADAKILPAGTSYISDVGMVGAEVSVLGMTKEISIQRFLNQEVKLERIPESGRVNVGAVYVEIDPATRMTKKIVKLDKIVDVV